jgi:uncharacterized FlaG/YvyC family protein
MGLREVAKVIKDLDNTVESLEREIQFAVDEAAGEDL